MTTQPGVPPGTQATWMPMPSSIPGCPPGLEYLTLLDQLLVHQKVELFEGSQMFYVYSLISIVSNYLSLLD